MLFQRSPGASLQPYLRCLWASDDTAGPSRGPSTREHVLPTGLTHLVVRLSDEPVRVAAPGDPVRLRSVGLSVVSGARALAYVKDVSRPSRGVGVQLRPGAVERIVGVSAGELAGRHTPLELLWGPFAGELRERLAACGSLETQVDLLEVVLLARLASAPGRAVRPEVVHALRAFAAGERVSGVVQATGASHRRFVRLFRAAVGLTPKLYCRVLRFQAAVQRARDLSTPLVEVALATGYSDQAHFSREFVEFAGVTPSDYRAAAPFHANHVPVVSARIAEARSIFFKTRAVRRPESPGDTPSGGRSP